MIDLKQCISIIESGTWFSIRFITADVHKGTGGKVLEIPKARIARRFLHSLPNHARSEDAEKMRDPNHSLHFTRNIELPNKQIRKVHPFLITHINHEPVL